MSDPAGEPLTRRLAEGKQEAFAQLYDQFAATLFRVAFVLLGSRPDAEDAVQEVFVSLVRGRAKVAGVSDLRAYLLTSIRNAAAKIAARRRMESASLKVLAEKITIAAQPAPVCEQSARLEEAILSLSPEQRQVIGLKTEAALTFSEIAEVLNISANTAGSRYRYALEKLRFQLQETPRPRGEQS